MLRLRSVLRAMPILLGAWAARPATAQSPAPAVMYEVYAVQYGTIADFPVRHLVAGADTTRTLDIAMMVWALTGSDGRIILVDAGFYRPHFLEQWQPVDFTRPADALAPLGIRADDVTDVVVTHVHWDHLDGADLFPNARVWIQQDEYDYYVGGDGRALRRGIDSADAAMLHDLRAAGRVRFVPGDAAELLPGITAYTGGRHTWASQYVTVATASGPVVIASDNCYLYENLERHAAIAQTLDAASNLAAQERMRTLAADPRLIVPGHDPAVFVRFPAPGGGIARIR